MLPTRQQRRRACGTSQPTRSGIAVSLGCVYGVSETGYGRYVAIGDSQTEGLWDGDDAVGFVGFADRLAALLDSHYPGLHYANLAIRGKLVADVLTEQVPPALAMRPDLITVCVGMNDVIQPGWSFGRALTDLEYVYAALAESGATVVTTTFPNVAQFLPLGRLVSGRLARINDAIRAAAEQYDFRLVDLYSAPSMRDLDTWDIDRVHASTKGHILFAAAAAEALNLPGSNHDWAEASGSLTRLPFKSHTYGQLRWAHEKLRPWVWRRLRGMSSADGRVPRRPNLAPLFTPSAGIAARLEQRSGILDA